MSFFIKTVRSRPVLPERSAWLRRMQEQAQVKAAIAADRIGPSAQRARVRTGEQILVARRWTAPQLHRASGYVENDLAPRLSAMLSSTAQRIEPPRMRRRLRNTILIILGAAGAVGVAGALLTRYKLMQDTYDELADSPTSTVSERVSDVDAAQVGESAPW